MITEQIRDMLARPHNISITWTDTDKGRRYRADCSCCKKIVITRSEILLAERIAQHKEYIAAIEKRFGQ